MFKKSGFKKEILQFWKPILTFLIPFAALPLPLLKVFPDSPESRAGWVLLVLGFFWGLELIPLAATALLPVVFFPVLGILSTDEVCKEYLKGTTMLFLGGLIVAIAVEHSNLHKRIAGRLLLAVGLSPRLLMFGFMLPTAFLSMWISNTAVAAMMLPILQSVLEELESSEEMRTMLLLAVAYSANIGGTGTLIGTGPNVVIYETISKCEGQPINFLSWLYFSIPLLLVNLIISWVWLQVVFIGAPWKNTQLISSEKEVKIKTLLRAQQEELGRVTREEYTVIFCFSSLVLLWLFRAPGFMDGWNIISSVAIADATPAIFVAVLLMAVPKASGEMFLPWQVIEKKLQWGVIIVLGGGFALSLGLEKSGLTTLVGHQLAMFQDWNRGLLMFVIQAIVSLITQVASNSATASMLLPVLLKLCLTIKMNPLYLLLPAALSCSYAFILPVSTGPNALVYEASGMKIWSMAKAGLGLNFITLFSTGGLVQLYGTALFDLQSFPDWAQNCTISP